MRADCIEKVVCLQGDTNLYQRVSTPRPAPKICLKDFRKLKQQQQQQQQDTLLSTGKFVTEQNQGTPIFTGKPVAEEENPFKSWSQKFKEFHKMQCSKIKEEWPKFKSWWTSYELSNQQTLSLPTWARKGKSNRSSKESKKTIQRLGKSNCMIWEMFPRKHSARPAPSVGLRDWLYCTCGVCLRPSPEQKRKIKSQFDVLSIPYYTVENGLLTRSKTWAEPVAIWSLESERYKAKCAKERTRFHFGKMARWRKVSTFSNCCWMDRGVLPILGFNCVCWHLIYGDMEWALKIMRIISRADSMMEQNQNRRNIDPISHEHFARLQPKTERGKDEPVHSQTPKRMRTSNWKQREIGKRRWKKKVRVGMAKTTGHSVLPLRRQPGGSHKNGKSHKNNKNGKDSTNGKNKCSISESSLYMMNLFKKWQDHQSFFAKILHIRNLFSRSFDYRQWQFP